MTAARVGVFTLAMKHRHDSASVFRITLPIRSAYLSVSPQIKLRHGPDSASLLVGITMRSFFLFCLASLFSFTLLMETASADNLPIRVEFASRDGSTQLVGYLFVPPGPQTRHPAIVMMHGRAGAYSSLANDVYDASTLSKRHAWWGHFWTEQNYVALLVDGFGPRGYAAGFPRHSYNDRPEALNEVTVRPLDAYGALAYLKSRPDVDPDRIALQGWSNGGSATLATLADTTLQTYGLTPAAGFKGGVAFYPACGLHSRFDGAYRPYAPLRVFSGDADEEVSAKVCKRLVDRAAASGGNIAITIFPGATHSFDDPGHKRQSVPDNAAATEEATAETLSFVRGLFGR